jgi:hypothetical protein
MLRKAVQGAVVAGAATLLAIGSASPAMAQSHYDLSQSDFGIEILNNLCVAVYDVVDIIDVDVLTAQGGASCDDHDTTVNTMVDDTDAKFDGGHHWDDKKHHGWND